MAPGTQRPPRFGVRFDAELLAAAIASLVHSGDDVRRDGTPKCCRDRSTCLRRASTVVAELGIKHFRTGRWRNGLTPLEQAAADAIGKAAVAELFPELLSGRPTSAA